MDQTEARKSRHLDICLDDDVASRADAGFSGIRLRHEALPEFALEDVDTRVLFLGHQLRAPLLISSMTGGTERAGTLNRNLAIAAEEAGIALALGSQRAAIENAALLSTYDVRSVAPNVMLFANLGAVQLNYGVRIDDVRKTIAAIGANGLFLHFNPLQEALQSGGDTNFRGLEGKIRALCSALDVPVLAKGVGSGMSPSTARRLINAGVRGIDVAGAGGTSWARVEGKRADDPMRERLAESFGDWGYPTASATARMRAEFPTAKIIASGGLRSGIDIAKAIAIGADLCGIGLPFLEAATQSADAVRALIDEYLTGLRIAQFASGSRSLAALRDALVA